MAIAVGVDACKSGWIAVAIDDAGVLDVQHLPRIGSVETLIPEASVIAIDIPIGLPETGRREADVAARSFLGARRSPVFFTPVRAALEAATHAESTAVSARLTGFVAWSARRILHGQAVTLPDPPPAGPDGRPTAIWA